MEDLPFTIDYLPFAIAPDERAPNHTPRKASTNGKSQIVNSKSPLPRYLTNLALCGIFFLGHRLDIHRVTRDLIEQAHARRRAAMGMDSVENSATFSNSRQA